MSKYNLNLPVTASLGWQKQANKLMTVVIPGWFGRLSGPALAEVMQVTDIHIPCKYPGTPALKSTGAAE